MSESTEVAVPEQKSVSMERFEAMRTEMLQLVTAEGQENELLRESVTDLVLAMDNLGWKPFGGSLTAAGDGPQLHEIATMSRRLRDFAAGNPLAKKAIEARTGYVWGQGVKISSEGRADGLTKLQTANDRTLFSPRARNELERAAATDGNLFFVLDPKTKRVLRVPLLEITGFVRDPEDRERINYYRREWTSVSTDPASGSVVSTEKKMWYPAWDLTETAKPGQIDGIQVAPKQAMIVMSFNTMTGWLYGLPDLFTVVWYLTSYKEYIEAGFSVTKALAKFAMKSMTPTKAGAQRAAARVAAPVDPSDVNNGGYGKMANAYGGADVQAISKSGADFNFESGEPIAALIAAGMGLTVDVLLAKAPQSGEQNLGEAVVKAMIGRQQEWDWLLTSIFTFMGLKNADVTFPPVRTVPVHRAIQAVVMAAGTNAISALEVRGMLVSLLGEYGIEDAGVLPKKGAWIEFTTGLNPQKQADQAATAAKATADAQANKASGNGQDPNHPGTTPLPDSGAGPTQDGNHDQRKSQ